MLRSSPIAPPVNDPAHVRRIMRRHGLFMLAASVALGGLYAEEAWSAQQFWGYLGPSGALILGAAVVLVALVGNALALILPPRLVRPENFPRPVGAFATAAGMGFALAGVTSVIALLLLLLLVGFNLEATSILLKDVYLYTLLAVLIHGLLYYVRHMHWLYDEFGGADSPLKPIAASGGIGALIFILTVVFLPLDLQGIQTAAPALRGLTSLHIYGRDLYLLTLALVAYAWHLRWIADH